MITADHSRRSVNYGELPRAYCFLPRSGSSRARTSDSSFVLMIQASCRERRPAWMTRLHWKTFANRALARADAGESVRLIAEALQISPSCVTKWKNLRRETGGVSARKIGGHKKPVLSGINADWLRKRIPF